MWYVLSLLLSFNRIFNFVIGNRGGGKTFAAKCWAINDFIKHGNTFIWVRRYKSELKKIGRFFEDVIKENKFPDHKLEVKGWKFYCDDKLMGEVIPLSVSMQEKSVPFPTVNKIIFDEFVIKKGTLHYLPDEVEVFLELYNTIARLRNNVRVVFIGNNVSIVNPYFLYWHIKPDISKRFTILNSKATGIKAHDHIAVEFYKNQEYINQVKNTRFGQLIEGTAYGDYSIENNVLDDNEVFVAPKSSKADFMLGIKYSGKMYGFWVDYNEGLIYVNNQYDPSSYALYAITKDDHEPNLLLIKNLAQCKPMQRIVYAFQHGLIRFVDMSVKNQFYEFMQYFVR